MPAKIAVYFTFKELNGTACTLGDFRESLSSFQLEGVLYLCSALNCLLGTFDDLDPQAHDELVRDFFPPATQSILRELAKQSQSPRFVFHRQQLLFVAKEALSNCSTAGKDPRTLPFLGGLGLVLLMANDHLDLRLPFGTHSDDELLGLAATFMPVLEATGRIGDVLRSCARSVFMLSQSLKELRGKKEYVDIPALFECVTELPLSDYQALFYGTLSRYVSLDSAKFRQDPKQFFLERSRCFAESPYSQEFVNRFFDMISVSPRDLSQSVLKEGAGPNDFTIFRDKPIIEEGLALYPIDISFLSEKFESGPFWAVLKQLQSEREKQALHSFWGLAFQEYLHWLLGSAVDGKLNKYIPSPKFRGSSEEVCDGLIVCGGSVVMIEYKGNTFTAESKYSGSVTKLRQELEKKLLGQNDGIGQLAKSIARVFRKENPEPVEGIETRSITNIYPLVVTRDNIGKSLGLNALMNRHFRRMLNSRQLRPRVVTPAFLMSVEDLEEFSGYLLEVQLCDILAARYRKDHDLLSNWDASANDAVVHLGVRRNVALDKTFKATMDSICDRLFPGQRLTHLSID